MPGAGASVGELLSVGIDIGTTSSHLIFSRLRLDNLAGANQVPRLNIAEREIIYESPVYLTPLSPGGLIDAEAVCAILESEYEKAGIDPASVQCGAAIITGGSARLPNAREVIERLAHLAGDFVAASAGPHMESLLAARGSGAATSSRLERTTVCNIDIGGGTTNIAVYREGEPAATWCLDLGARFLQLDEKGVVLAVSASGRKIARSCDIDAEPGMALDSKQLETLAERAAALIVSGIELPGSVPEYLTTDVPPATGVSVDGYWFSGGVAQLMVDRKVDQAVHCLEFGDMGHYLASALRGLVGARGWPVARPECPIRATVIGAGSHSLMLSGFTVTVAEALLPLSNLPILRLPADSEDSDPDPESLSDRVSLALRLQDLSPDRAREPLAVYLPSLGDLGHASLESWCRNICRAIEENYLSRPFVFVLREDAGMALGLLLRRALGTDHILVVDGIDCSDGDFLEIGRPLPGGMTVPVVVKTLIFR
ncbi:MAG: ethanolamine ammonia-lyase reactivating factor EutA [Candidatus Melainabacteria bacterium]|nr:ethanolamine ammonia-lyase reactivating factor EutA [Candidatus Melainabacteria bacterium]